MATIFSCSQTMKGLIHLTFSRGVCCNKFYVDDIVYILYQTCEFEEIVFAWSNSVKIQFVDPSGSRTDPSFQFLFRMLLPLCCRRLKRAGSLNQIRLTIVPLYC